MEQAVGLEDRHTEFTNLETEMRTMEYTDHTESKSLVTKPSNTNQVITWKFIIYSNSEYSVVGHLPF